MMSEASEEMARRVMMSEASEEMPKELRRVKRVKRCRES
jgi:hypothetical protein